jgi:hypothetical protein
MFVQMGAVQANVKMMPEEVTCVGARKKALAPREAMEKSWRARATLGAEGRGLAKLY